jgi:pimeloyl-ACP methyl ester carboxylesterase
MPDPTNYPPSCAVACEQGCPASPAPISLPVALARFEKEARHGTCDTGRYRMPYFSWGAGPPVVFIHGLGDSARSFALPMAHLSRAFRCVGYELPAGRTDGARLGRYTHAALVDDLFALLDHLALPRSYLLASSFGATIALAALAARPERVPRAILQGGLAHRRLVRGERFFAWLARWLPGTMGGVPKREKVLRKGFQRDFAGRPEELWRYFIAVTARPRVQALGYQARWMDSLDLRPLLPAIRQPVLLVCGDRDRLVPPRFQDELMRGLPSAGRVVIEDCGHIPSYTHPELFAEVVCRFLTPGCPEALGPACAGRAALTADSARPAPGGAGPAPG